MTETRAVEQNRAPALDLLLPRYHVTGDRNWINDPNGPIHRDGVYHLFFQANPEAPHWGSPHWGHVSSRDLVHWQRHGIALSPSADGPDRDGCWSGCARSVGGQPVVYYTGVVGDGDDRVESVCRAVGSADLTRWTKDPANPLVPGPPDELGSGYHRDPFLWQDEDGWNLLLGSGTRAGERHGTVIRYRSDDGVAWTYCGLFFEAPRYLDGLDLGEHWECPQLLRYDDRWVLLISCQDPKALRPLLHTVYFVGTIEDGGFRPDGHGVLDHGDAFYAPAAAVDATGRVLAWGWIQERLPEELHEAMSAVGALSLPRVLDLVGDDLRTAPVPELTALRTAAIRSGPVDLPPGDAFLPLGPGSRQMEIRATVTASRGRAGVSVDLSPDGGEAVRIGVDSDRGVLVVDRSDAAPSPLAPSSPIEVALPVPDGPWSLRVLLDGSVVEVFLDDRIAVTTRVYPASRQLGPVRAYREDGDAELDCDLWHLYADVIGGVRGPTAGMPLGSAGDTGAAQRLS